MLRNLIITSFVFTNLTFAQSCYQKRMVGNQNKQNVLQGFNTEFKGFNKEFGIGNFTVKKATNVSFSGCKGYLKIKIKIERLWRSNAKGFARVKGNITSINNKEVCLNNITIYNLNLSNTASWEERLYLNTAKPFLGKLARCYKYKN